MKTCFPLIAFVLLATSTNAMEQHLTEAWKKLDQAMQREIGAPKDDDEAAAERGEGRNQRRMVAAQLRSAMENAAQNGSLENALTQVVTFFRSEEVMREVENLRAAVQKDREAKEAANLARVNDLTKRATEAVRTAREPRDLDAILRDLGQIAGQREDHLSETSRTAIYKLQPIRQFLLRWQDYLVAAKSGDAKRAVEALRNLASSPSETADLFPRSEILALIEQTAAKSEPGSAPAPQEGLDEILAKLKTLPDLASVIKQLHMLQNRRQSMGGTSGGLEGIGSAINALMALEKPYREFEAGLPTNLEAALNQNDSRVVDLVPLRVQLLLLMLPRFMAPPEIKPQSGETAQAFVERVITLARERGDVGLMARAREAKRILSRGGQLSGSAGLAAFTAAQNQEAAGQYMLAVVSYENALKNGTDDISPKLIGEKLDAVKTAHPREYEQGVAAFLTPLPPMYTRPPYNYLDQGPIHAPTPNPALAVPGGPLVATPSPAASVKSSPSPRATTKPR
jgi:hypothetical protein